MRSSKTQPSYLISDHAKVNSSFFSTSQLNSFSKQNVSTHQSKKYLVGQSQNHKINGQNRKYQSQDHAVESFYRVNSSYMPQHSQCDIIVIPDVSKSRTQYFSESKLSCQLNQISKDFNKQNKRVQEALFQIRESTQKKQKQRSLYFCSRMKQSQLKQKMNEKPLVMNKLKYNPKKSYLKLQKNIFRKQNLSDLMIEQKNLIKIFGIKIRMQ